MPSPRERAQWAAIGYALVVVLLLAASTGSDRYPVPAAAVAVALLLPPLGAGLAGRSWWLLALVPLSAVLGIALAFLRRAENAILPFFYGVLGSATALLLLPIGVAIGRRVERRWVILTGAVLLPLALLVVPVAVVQSRRTVSVDRPDPLAIDERAGTFRGVGLDAPIAAVRRRLGPGQRVRADDDRRRGVGPNVTTGPVSIAASGEELRYGRDVSFSLDDEGLRVQFVEIADRRAQTRVGVGPGDSLARFRRAYPGLRCGEGDVGSDEVIPYPACRVRLGERRWLYVAGSYDRPGRPAVILLLSRTRPAY